MRADRWQRRSNRFRVPGKRDQQEILVRSYARDAAAECPFCIATPADRKGHIRQFHRDRLHAIAEYQRVIAEGGSQEEAQQAYNRVLQPARPGVYDRTAFRSTHGD